MIGNDSMDFGLKIDLSLRNIYKSWFLYRKGKKPSTDMDNFQYNLENRLFSLWKDLNNKNSNGTDYKHGQYRKFMVTDNKTREISVADIRDRVVHRLIYDYLTLIYDSSFIYDAWSCRVGKGLTACIDRAQNFIKKYPNGFVWRADIRKFFDNVDHDILFRLLKRKIKDGKTLYLLKEIIDSFETGKGRGMPIGNLTSQIFSNIYMNELDRHIKSNLKIKHYLRYGDDFLIFGKKREELENIRTNVSNFLKTNLFLNLHHRNNLIAKTKYGLKFLGVILYPKGRTLSKRNLNKIKENLNVINAGSYFGVLEKHCNLKKKREFQWRLAEMLIP